MARENDYGFNLFSVDGSNTALLDKEEVEEKESSDLREEKERMQKNLDKILHYDLYEKEAAEEAESVSETPVESVAQSTLETVSETQEEDIRPTSTTMQFGDGDLDQIYQEMANQKSGEKESYKLNSKGKLVIVLYSLAVAVIMALIVLNTGVLAMLSKNYEAKSGELNDLQTYNVQINKEIENISDNGHVSEIAENDYGMILR